jgi:hypothetical protein
MVPTQGPTKDLSGNLAPRDGLLGAARLAPSGSPCGRSPPLRGVVEPGLFMSAVRMGGVERFAPKIGFTDRV